MSNKFETLSEVEIEKIGQLVEILDKSAFDHLTLELADFKLTVGTGAMAPVVAAAPAPVAAPAMAASAPAPLAPAAQAAAAAAPVSAKKDQGPVEGLIDVTATTMGRFYSRPDPNSTAFVTVGASVTADSTVGLLEVMKLFNSVAAGLAGTVEQICVEDAELVEFGQVLMRIRPAA
jgi:acetyl-CoA carboxylase biotin carboxyl carrier protein